MIRFLALASSVVLAACGGRPISGADAGATDSGTLDAGARPDSGSEDAGSDAGVDGGTPSRPLPPLPLSVQGRWIVDAQGHRFKLAAVNWYGAEEQDFAVAGLELADVHAIAHLIRSQGFNAVRLPWSNEMYESNPVVDAGVLAANPQLQGLHALDVFDAVVDALAAEGLVVILDNHTSRADWCCSDTDGNGLWYTPTYPEQSWIADWKGIAQRYLAQPAVVGADLRNELRSGATWGGADAGYDWHGAAQRGGDAVLQVNPNLLVFVEGINYATDLSGVGSLPVQLSVPNRLVYEAHDYAWDHNGLTSYQQLATDLGNKWGYILVQGQPYTAPIWVGEFGTCHTSTSCLDDSTGQGLWFHSFSEYLFNGDIDWSYWAFNGTEATGSGRTYGAEETYGVVDVTWTQPALRQLLGALQQLQPASQGP